MRTRIPMSGLRERGSALLVTAVALALISACSSTTATGSPGATTEAAKTASMSAPASSAPASPAPASSPAAPAFPVAIENCGRTLTVDAAPTATLTMNQGATEVMLSLGLQGSMVGTAYLDDAVADKYEAAYQTVPVLAKEYPNQEAVLAAKPDFVYASYSSAFDPEAAGSQDDLAALGIASYLSPFGCADKALRAPVSFDSVWAEISDIGTILGIEDGASGVIASQAAVVDAAKATAAGEGLDVFWYDSGDKTPTAGAGGGSPQVLLDSVGATNIFADIEGGWADVSWERVVKADPDVIVLADASWSTADEKKKYLESDPALQGLSAVKNERFVVLPFSETTAGVRLADGVQSLSDQLAALPS